jgi:hypothetical protein
MSDRDTLVRALHDVGGAAWFGGSLMGAIGLNGAASDAPHEDERVPIAADGWARWAPFNAAAVGAHLVGGAGLLLANRGRAVGQKGVTSNTIIKTALTGAAVAATAYSGVLGAKQAKVGPVPAEGANAPSAATPPEVAKVQKQQRLLQWVIPVLTGSVLVLGAQQGEQQKPSEQATGWRKRLAG